MWQKLNMISISLVVPSQLQCISFQLIEVFSPRAKYKTTSKQIHESSVLHKSSQLEKAARRCSFASASAEISFWPWLSSLPSSSSTVAWSETKSPYSHTSNVVLTIVSQVTIAQWWKESWTDYSLVTLFVANFLFIATFLWIVAMVRLFPQIQNRVQKGISRWTSPLSTVSFLTPPSLWSALLSGTSSRSTKPQIQAFL